MRMLTKLLPIAAAAALVLGTAGGAGAEPAMGPARVVPVQGYWVDPPPRYVPGPPRRYRGPPPRHWGPPPGYYGYGPPRGYYAPPPPAYYAPPPPRYYRPPPPGVGLYFRF